MATTRKKRQAAKALDGPTKAIQGEGKAQVEAAEVQIPETQVAPRKRLSGKDEFLVQCMRVPAFRRRVISRLIKKLG